MGLGKTLTLRYLFMVKGKVDRNQMKLYVGLKTDNACKKWETAFLLPIYAGVTAKEKAFLNQTFFLNVWSAGSVDSLWGFFLSARKV